MIEISKMAQKIEPSLTRTLFNKALQYSDVIDFTLGDPDIVPHINIREAGCQAIMNGKTRYSQNAGLLSLRETISKYCYENERLDYNANSEIIVTVGGMEGLYLSLLAILNPEDEVIIPAPYWINYKHMVQMCSAVPIITDSNEDLSFSIQNVKNNITSKTKVIILNTPSNPSGKIISKADLEQIAAISREHNITIIADEVYKTLLYDDAQYDSISKVGNLRDNLIIVNSLSKQFSMTGWRIGYVLAPAEVVKVMCQLQENIAACAPLPSQYAAMEALSHAKEYSEGLRSEFAKRRNTLINGLKTVPFITCDASPATFYAMLNIKELQMGSIDFAYKLLDEARVAVVPGVTYGECCNHYVRLAYTQKEEIISEGVNRIRKFVNSLKS